MREISIFRIEDMIRNSKLFNYGARAKAPSSSSTTASNPPKPELIQAACECLAYIVKMRSSELLHVFRLDDEEREFDEDDIECEILKTFINCNH